MSDESRDREPGSARIRARARSRLISPGRCASSPVCPVPALPFERDPHAFPDFSRMTRHAAARRRADRPARGAGAARRPRPRPAGDTRRNHLPWAITLIASGGLHEDGLADMLAMRSVRGGDRDRRLAIIEGFGHRQFRRSRADPRPDHAGEPGCRHCRFSPALARSPLRRWSAWPGCRAWIALLA